MAAVAVPPGASSAGISEAIRVKYAASAITPCLIASAMPARSSRGGNVASTDGSATTAAGG